MRSGVKLAFWMGGLILCSSLGLSQVPAEDAINLGPVVNSQDRDYAPFVSADGNTLYFASDREGGLGGQDIWVSHRGPDGHWGQPSNPGSPLNSPGNEGPDTFSADGRVMFFTACQREDGLGACDLYVSQLGPDGAWSPPQNLGPPVNSRSNEANASLSLDGRALYFVSIRPGGLGGWDLWATHLTDQGWSEPENLGPKINTPGNEFIAFIHPNGEELYFSSDGQGGFGGSDIFYTSKTPSGWSDPVNLGPVINTPANDMYFTIPAAGDLVYLSSNRDDSLGKEDLYSVAMPLVLNRLKLIALAPTPRPPAPAPTPPAPVAQAPMAEGVKPAPVAQAPVTEVAKPAPIIPEKVTQETITRAAATQEPVVLKNVLFDLDKADLRAASRAELENLIQLLHQNPDLNIEIRGHTDSTGSYEYNIDLSLRRALAVHTYLIHQGGIDPRRLRSSGWGEVEPITGNDTEEGRQVNRRVEFKIVKP